jgi:hypothetical protein
MPRDVVVQTISASLQPLPLPSIRLERVNYDENLPTVSRP